MAGCKFFNLLLCTRLAHNYAQAFHFTVCHLPITF